MSGETGACTGCTRTAPDARQLLPARSGNGLLLCDRCVAECADAIASQPTRIPGAARPCAFCDKSEDQVAVMIGIGPKMICDECVDAFRADVARA